MARGVGRHRRERCRSSSTQSAKVETPPHYPRCGPRGALALSRAASRYSAPCYTFVAQKTRARFQPIEARPARIPVPIVWFQHIHATHRNGKASMTLLRRTGVACFPSQASLNLLFACFNTAQVNRLSIATRSLQPSRSIWIVASFLTCILPINSSTATVSERLIAQQYRDADASYGRMDMDGLFRSYSADYTLLDQNGHRHTLEELKAATLRNWRRPPNAVKIERRARTVIQSITPDGDQLVAKTEADVTLGIVDTTGTTASAHDISRGEDRWRKTPQGWKIQSSRIINFNRTAQANPSYQLRSANALIRQNTENTMEFNR